MTDNGFDCISSFTSSVFDGGHVAFLTGKNNLWPAIYAMTLIAQIRVYFFRRNVCDPLNLLQSQFQRMPVIRLAVLCHGTKNEVSLVAHGIACFAAKFIFLVRFAFGDALDLRCVP